jgi:hypothetical protein
LASLQVIASSHPVQQNYRRNGTITLSLETINLPDTSVGESSRCFILYTLEPNISAANNRLIAHSNYFNYNTNYGIPDHPNNAIIRVLDVPDAVWSPFVLKNNQVQVVPNPAKGQFWLQTTSQIPDGARLSIFDTSNKTIHEQIWHQGEPIQAQWPAGLYFIRLASVAGEYWAKILIE